MCRLNPTNKDKTAPVTVTADAVTAVKIRSTSSNKQSSSWIWLYHFITASFHGNLGMISFFITFLAFITTYWCTSSSSSSSNSKSNSSIFVGLSFIIVSIITTTILSIHSSYYMLNQSPYSSTILDYDLNLNKLLPSSLLTFGIIKKRNRIRTFNIKVVPPHRDAFNRTSIIMQYANSRILFLLQRHYYYNNQEQNNNQEQDSSSFSILSGIIVWIFVIFGCIRMLPVKIPDIFSSSSSSSTAVAAVADDDTNPGTDDESLSKNRLKKKKEMPTFWYNGNTYCFVLPMMISLIGDFIMTIYCEYHYHYHFHYNSNENNQASSLSLYDYHTKYWLSIYHLLFLQLIAHIIAFSFTLIFRIRDKNKSNKRKSSMSMSNRSTIFNIRTLYWVCTIGVYALVIIGFRKVIKTFQSLHNI